ncbi:hypothetical protein EA656_15585 [Pseudoxanthomonas winnipegensis]|uniref:Uncharacterized protein n=1 Tax=Pseudoxanthomonas winnipegensis TaxID=2480810 RepID=A0A4Q8LRC8_9GAMM|nr:hypothetical protein EA663_14090 [Pseudoxanthomonas winnipegensis]TAA33848.1 hypothetical protein EA656_15585 [Pseudoxanthomonas winnipegensis]
MIWGRSLARSHAHCAGVRANGNGGHRANHPSASALAFSFRRDGSPEPPFCGGRAIAPLSGFRPKAP